MKVQVERIGIKYGMDATNEYGSKVKMDCTATNGVNAVGSSPMELLLMAVAGCSSIDVEIILTKMKQEFIKLRVEVEGTKTKVDNHSIFSEIHLHYSLEGAVAPEKLEKAIDMSLGTYCSVAKILGSSAKITSSFTII